MDSVFSEKFALAYKLKFFDSLLQLLRDFFWCDIAGELHRLPDPHPNRPWWRKFLSRLLAFKKAINPHRQNRNAKILREQSDSRPKWIHLSIGGMPALGKYQYAVAPVDGSPA